MKTSMTVQAREHKGTQEPHLKEPDLTSGSKDQMFVSGVSFVKGTEWRYVGWARRYVEISIKTEGSMYVNREQMRRNNYYCDNE